MIFHCFHFKFIPNFKNKFILFPSKHLSWWRRLEDVFRLLLLQKTSSTRPLDQHQNIHLGHRSSRRLQNIFKTSSRPRLQGARYLEDVFKTSSRRLAKLSSRHLQDVFNVYHQAKLFFKMSYGEDDVVRRWLDKKNCLGHSSGKFLVSVQNFQEWILWICQRSDCFYKQRYYC